MVVTTGFVMKAGADAGYAAEERRGELYVECALFVNGAPFGLPMRTRFVCLLDELNYK